MTENEQRGFSWAGAHRRKEESRDESLKRTQARAMVLRQLFESAAWREPKRVVEAELRRRQLQQDVAVETMNHAAYSFNRGVLWALRWVLGFETGTLEPKSDLMAAARVLEKGEPK